MTNIQAAFLGGCILAAAGAIVLALAELDTTTRHNSGSNLGPILLIVGACLIVAPLVIARVQRKDEE